MPPLRQKSQPLHEHQSQCVSYSLALHQGAHVSTFASFSWDDEHSQKSQPRHLLHTREAAQDEPQSGSVGGRSDRHSPHRAVIVAICRVAKVLAHLDADIVLYARRASGEPQRRLFAEPATLTLRAHRSRRADHGREADHYSTQDAPCIECSAKSRSRRCRSEGYLSLAVVGE